jgi:hypothetical protein
MVTCCKHLLQGLVPSVTWLHGLFSREELPFERAGLGASMANPFPITSVGTTHWHTERP